MGRNVDLLSHDEASKILGISPRWLTGLVRQGAVAPAVRGKIVRKSTYRATDIYALLRLRSQSLDLPTIANMAWQAQAVSRSAADKVGMLCKALGLGDAALARDEESMYQLWVRANAALNSGRSPATGALLEWAAVFNAIDEAYLSLIARATETGMPWDTYLRLANALMATGHGAQDTNLSYALACLDAARRNLRHVAYFYVLNTRGEGLANELFTKHAATDEVIGQLFPTCIEMVTENT
jgi:hypothetical protein